MSRGERWLPVVGYEGAYEVSDRGRVRSLLKGCLKKPTPLPSGYLCVWLHRSKKKRNRLVSRLVLEAFVGPPPSRKHQAAHGDGSRDNNRLRNLRWATPKENNADKKKHGTQMSCVGVANNRRVLNHTAVERMRDLRRAGCTHKQISEWIGTCLSNVCYVLQGRTWKHI